MEKVSERAETDIVVDAIAQLRKRLPGEWLLTKTAAPLTVSRKDSAFTLRSPDGVEAPISVYAKRLIEVRDVPRIRDQFDLLRAKQPTSIGLVAARYLAKSTRERLTEAELSYVDATGNLFLRADSPAVFLSDRGADSDPWRGPGRPRGTLSGGPAAMVVRTLLDAPGPWKISELVRASATSTGSVYRVIEFMEAEALVRRQDGFIAVPDWPALLRRWSEDYQFLRTNTITRWIAPRGIEAFLDRVRQTEGPNFAVTGSVAAATWAPYAPVRAAMLYTTDIDASAAAWGLRPTDTGANVILARPAYGVSLSQTIERPDGLRVVAPTQVAADLMSGPGRAPAEAEALVEWMTANEGIWRLRS
ncbi:hypothetical protein [Mycetocola saprophilus]|uniref:hypothetical protein n=1 Tax=Mycetocola saprophilus TaxID=76636 RepID=UPI0004C0032A|nr:hypothetical protein [Mycetocola saprophilus]